MLKFEVYPDVSNGLRWRLLASNGKIIADSGESYSSSEAITHSINLIKTYAPTAQVDWRKVLGNIFKRLVK